MAGKKDHPRLRAMRVGFSERLKAARNQPPFARRLRSIFVIFTVCAVLLSMRLVDLQVLRAEKLSASASQFRTRTEVIHAKRGDILDASGAVLATSVERYNVGVNQNLISSYVHFELNEDEELVAVGAGAAEAAKQLAPLLEMDQAELGGLLMGGEEKSSFVYIAKDISPEKWREIRELRITGIEPEQVMKREYPNGKVAGNVIGYLGLTGEIPEGETVEQPTGQAGIERTKQDVLTGKDGSITYQIADGAILPNAERTEVAAVDGQSVRLTVDRDLQDVVEVAVDKPIAEQGAEWASAVVVEIGTGRILALADSQRPDPGNREGTAPENWGARAVQGMVEPGSTGKLMTFAAALDQGVVTPESVFEVKDPITMPNGEEIHDNDEHEDEDMTVAGILAKSYNSGLVQIGDLVPDETRFEYMQKFGIGSLTGVELPAETPGLVNPPPWPGRDHYTTMFGQAWTASTVQLAQMVSVFGNDGVRVPVHIIESTIDADGQEHPTLVMDDSERVVSPETAHSMLDMMQAVTDIESTGWRAAVPGYNIAGKTGTAEVVDEATGLLTKRVGTFVGLVPAEDPQIAIAVTVYNADGAGYGGDVAAPVFKDTVSFAVRQLGIPPSTVPLVRLPWYPGEEIKPNDSDDSVG
ncbi:MAG: penicillin-binding protein 2 [Ancrocorticia sp.]